MAKRKYTYARALTNAARRGKAGSSEVYNVYRDSDCKVYWPSRFPNMKEAKAAPIQKSLGPLIYRIRVKYKKRK